MEEGLKIYHVNADAIVLKENIYFSILRMWDLGMGGHKIGQFL